ncbi:MAG: hypothetical protein VX899_13505 [Myxococcota bacterium]|nr:hypothetical protein [Myxococcota bacterium]
MAVALVYATAVEWSIHRYVFHGAGKKRGSPFSFHYFEHHKACRRNGNSDPDYLEGGLRWSPRTREIGGILGGLVLHLPIALLSWPAYLMLVFHGARYIYMHHRSHVDVEWCKQNMPWHYDHHMAPNQDANWCVTGEWFDKLMGTRVPYLTAEGLDPKRDMAA